MKGKDTRRSYKTTIGGQALSGGVMMRGYGKTAVAVRGENGDIKVKMWGKKRKEQVGLAKIPLARGVVRIFTAMGSAVRTYAAAAGMSPQKNKKCAVKRVLMYHGAEHKTIYCHEKGLPLTVGNVREQKRFHPRCGTSIAVNALIIESLFSAIIPKKVRETGGGTLDILLLLVSLGAGYEASKFCDRNDTPLTRVLSAPGLWAQRLTTREPEDEMIECAIKAAEAVVPTRGEADAADKRHADRQ